MSNVFKTPGSSRANKQQHNNLAVSNAAMPIYNSYANWLQGMQPEINQAYGNLFNMGTQNNVYGMAAAMTRRALMNSAAASRTAMNLYGNGALAQGAGISALNKGIDRANAFTAHQYDPSTQMTQLATGLNAAQTPLQNMQSLAGTIFQQPQVPTGKGPLDYIIDAGETAAKLGWTPFKK